MVTGAGFGIVAVAGAFAGAGIVPAAGAGAWPDAMAAEIKNTVGNIRIERWRMGIWSIERWYTDSYKCSSKGNCRIGDHADRTPDESDIRKDGLAGQLIFSDAHQAEIIRAGRATQSTRPQ
jgi:hypothetical protein